MYYIITDSLKENTFKIPTKIFVIGFNKTGTTSIHTIIPVMKIINKYDAFTDGNHFYFKKYYNRYLDSLFILNTLPIYSWILSRYKHAKNINLITVGVGRHLMLKQVYGFMREKLNI